jgi:hypothetical protein
MKRNIVIGVISIALAVLVLIALGAFTSSDASISRDVRNPDRFDGISLSVAAKVYILQDSECKLDIQADEDDLDKIETVVKNGKLEIKSKSWTASLKGNVIIHITMPELKDLSVSGSGSIIADSGFDCNELNMSVTGSGSIKMNKLTVQTVEALITGSGNIKLDGAKTAGVLTLTITGSGSYSAEELKVNEAMVRITGSGSAKIHVMENLETNITGSGNVLYQGDPMVNANSTGSGKTKKM